MGEASDDLADHWLSEALKAADIERAAWRPGQGVDGNRRTIPAVYDYYGRLYLERTCLEWAGMANLIGPALYAGFRDLGFLPDLVRRAVAAMSGAGSRRLARWAAAWVGGWYERTFLRMQKKVFEDQATLHQAYVTDGISQIEEFYRAGIIDVATRDAWRQIDDGCRTGDLNLIGLGNRTLLFREQLDILGWFYVRMFQRGGPVGLLTTYVITLIGTPSVPGAHSFPAQYPFVARLPGTRVGVRTPLAAGNIALFTDRWKLIEQDTLPCYLAYIRDDPESARKLIEQKVKERGRRYLLRAQIGRLAGTLLSAWRLDIGTLRPPPRPPVGQLRPLDLTRPPTRESVGLAEGAASKVWMNPRGRPFEIEILLPERCTYRAPAELAVMFSGRGGEPDRLTIRHPPMGIDACATLLGTLCAEWGVPAEAAAAWHDGAKRREAGDRRYLTQVFTGRDTGPVHIEFQVAHHVQDHQAVLTALFSWNLAESA